MIKVVQETLIINESTKSLYNDHHQEFLKVITPILTVCQEVSLGEGTVRPISSQIFAFNNSKGSKVGDLVSN